MDKLCVTTLEIIINCNDYWYQNILIVDAVFTLQVVRNATFPRCSKYLSWVFILLDIVYSLSTNTISCTHTSIFCSFVKPYDIFALAWSYIHIKWKSELDATVCCLIYFTAKSLYMFQVSQHPSSEVLKTVTAVSSTGDTRNM